MAGRTEANLQFSTRTMQSSPTIALERVWCAAYRSDSNETSLSQILPQPSQHVSVHYSSLFSSLFLSFFRAGEKPPRPWQTRWKYVESIIYS